MHIQLQKKKDDGTYRNLMTVNKSKLSEIPLHQSINKARREHLSWKKLTKKSCILLFAKAIARMTISAWVLIQQSSKLLFKRPKNTERELAELGTFRAHQNWQSRLSVKFHRGTRLKMRLFSTDVIQPMMQRFQLFLEDVFQGLSASRTLEITLRWFRNDFKSMFFSMSSNFRS